MRVALISDVHANMEALQVLLADLESADAVVCLGDLIGYYCQVNEVVDTVRSLRPLCLRGNHEHFLFNAVEPNAPEAVRFGVEYARGVLTAENRQWLETLPLCWGGELGGLSCLFAHGTPWSPVRGYLYADSSMVEHVGVFDYDLVAVGQTHRSMIRNGRPKLLNPGSVGQSRDRCAVAQALMIETDTGHVQCLERPYDPSPVLEVARRHGAGAWVCKHLV